MLRYLLSTLCIFLFFEDARLNTYKCASPDCSVPISTAKVKSLWPRHSEHEVSVRPGAIVDIYGIDTEKKNYLVKVKGLGGLHLLPQSVLKEDKNIEQKATHVVEDPFQQNQSPPSETSTKKEWLSKIERFNSIVLNISCPSYGEEIAAPLVDQPSSVENEEIDSPTGAVSESEGANKTDIVENNIPSETNILASSEANTSDGTENVIPKSNQVNLTAENQNQKEFNETGEDISTEVKEDLTEQKNNSKVTENVTETKENSFDSLAQTSTISNGSSNLLPENSTAGQLNAEPKVKFGDTPGAVLPGPTSLNNFMSDDNQTEGIRNDSLKMNSSNDASLNQPGTSDNETNPSIGSQRYETNSNTSQENEVVVSEKENSILNVSHPSKNEDINKADEKELPGSTQTGNASTSSKDSKNLVPHLSTGDYKPADGSVPTSKSGHSNKIASEDFDVADLVGKKEEDAGTTNHSVHGESENTTTSPAKNEEKAPQKTGQLATLPDSTASSSGEPKFDHHEPASPPPAGEHGLSNENSSPDSDKSDVKKPIQETKKNLASPDSTSNSTGKLKFDPRKPVAPVEEPGLSTKNVSPDSDKSDEEKDTQETKKSPDSTSNSPGKPKFDPRKPVAPVEEPGLSTKNVSPDSDKSDEEKDTQETKKSPTSPDSTSNSPGKPKFRKPVAPVEEPGLYRNVSPDSDKSDEQKVTQETGQSHVSPDFTSSSSTDESLKSDQSPVNPEKLEPSNKKELSDSDAIKSGTQEKKIKPTPSSSLNTPPRNTNDLSADHQAYDGSQHSHQTLEEVIFKEESAFYTDIFGYIGNFSSLLESATILQSYLNFEWLQKRNDSAEQQHCDEGSCPAFSIFDSMAKYGFDLSAINLQSWSLTELHQSKQTSLVAGILICTVLLFTTLISILRNSKKRSRISTLISVINQLEKKLLVATKEISLLEEQLTDAPVTLISQPATEVDYESNELLQQIELLQVRNTDLEDKVTYLEKELHNVTTSAFEMHKLLENSLSTQAQSRLAEDEVDTLRALTERQDRQIDDLMKEMDAIVTENRYLKDDLKKMEKESSSLTKKNLELSEKNRNLSLRLDQQIEETATMKSNYKSEIYQLQAKIEDLEINLRRSEFQIESLNRAFMDKHENKSDDQMQALQDDVQLKLQLSTLKAMNNELSAELKEQKNARRTLDDHIGDVIRKCNELTQALEVSEKGRNEAVNKLQVLTDYFNEKESQLQKEISAKEKLFMESENKDQLLSQKLSSLKEEIKNNKDRNEELKKEIEAQERSFKTQLATAEQKSRDLWFALRQAERKYQESEKEAATLRNKILILENNLSSVNQKLNEKQSTNGEMNGQPLMFAAEMLSYRGPNDFMPPPPSPLASHSPEFFPPEPSYSPDERLPPLGGRRVPSPPSLIVPPPEDDDFKPPLPHAQYMPGRSRHESLNMSSYYGDSAQYN